MTNLVLESYLSGHLLTGSILLPDYCFN